ncbi:hypothetical protein TNCV_3422911 [Trichonephila clavipes]|nr:hypothetical protein TNCV_3422911 [Trichonephila clavipes]
MFADDTAILAQSNELQLVTHFYTKHIAKLEDWFSTWKIALNVAKQRPSSSLTTSKKNHRNYIYTTRTYPGPKAPNT